MSLKSKTLALVLLAAATGLSLSGCRDEGTAESANEKVEEAAVQEDAAPSQEGAPGGEAPAGMEHQEDDGHGH